MVPPQKKPAMTKGKKNVTANVDATTTTNRDFMDTRYHADKPICSIPATSVPDRRTDCFVDYKRAAAGVPNYTISQTYCKLDAGETKINFKETRMEYLSDIPDVEVAKVGPHPVKYGTGPIWEYYEERLARKIERMQRIYRAQFGVFQRKKVKERRAKVAGLHDRLLKKVGPDWYQELSNQQFRTVDRLRYSIVRDLTLRRVCYTRDDVAELGLVLRPNTRHLEIALKFCCGCPVEFLLILYQVINPKRTEYSLNDRLLLSAVVHLTMTSTLKELHIRIPSPPRIATRKSSAPKGTTRRTRIKYESPYLVPFTFVPEPRRFTGVYVNKHVQRPESIYFEYLNELKYQPKFDVHNVSLPSLFTQLDPGWRLTLEIFEECFLAQAIYNRLARDDMVAPNLYMPNIYPQCVRNADDDEEEDANAVDGVTNVDDDSTINVIDVTKQYDYLRAIDDLQEQLTYSNRLYVIGGIAIDRCGTPVYVVTAVLDVKRCPCATVAAEIERKRVERETYENAIRDLQNDMIARDAKYAIGGVTIAPSGDPVYVLGSCLVNRDTICTKHRATLREQRRMDAIKERLATRCAKYVLGGVARLPNGRSCFIVAATLPMKRCTCGEHEDIVRETNDVRTPAEKAQEQLRAMKFVVAGVVVKDGSPVYIVGGVYDAKECTCGNHVLVYGKVKDKRRRLEKLQNQLATSGRRFVLGGVTYDPHGLPVYHVTAVLLSDRLCDRHCKIRDGHAKLCRQHAQVERLHARITGLAATYVVAGVTYDRTDGEPVFVLSQAYVRNGLCPRHLESQRQHSLALVEQRRIKEQKRKFAIGGVVYTGRNEKRPVYAIQGVVVEKALCRRHELVAVENDAIDEMQERFARIRSRFVIGGVTRDRSGRPVYIIQAALALTYVCAHTRTLARRTKPKAIDAKNVDGEEEVEEEDEIEKEVACYGAPCSSDSDGSREEEEAIEMTPSRRIDDPYARCVSKLQRRLATSAAKFVISGLTVDRATGDPVYIISAVIGNRSRSCNCRHATTADDDDDDASSASGDECDAAVERLHAHIAGLRQRFAIGGVTYDGDGAPTFIIDSVVANACVCTKKPPTPPQEVYPLFYRLEADRIRERFADSATKYVNGGIAIAPNGQPVFHVRAAIPLRECPCVREMRLRREREKKLQREREDYEADMRLKLLADEEKLVVGSMADGGDADDEPCPCKEACERFVKRTLSQRCRCEKCEEDLRRARRVFVVDGVAVRKGDPIRVIEGVAERKECDCLQRYEARAKRYEELKARNRATRRLKSLPRRYVVSGVTMGPRNEPVYVLSGTVPERRCPCVDAADEEEKRLREAPPPMPPGGPRFIVSGIRYSASGNVYIVAGVVPIPDCRCMSVYRDFIDQHAPCLELYERYMEKVDRDLKAYMVDLEDDEQYWKRDDDDDSFGECSCDDFSCVDVCTERVVAPARDEQSCAVATCPAKSKKKKKKSKKICQCYDEPVAAMALERNETIDVDEPDRNEIDEAGEGRSTDEWPPRFELNEEHLKNIELKRYMILSKIPSDPIAQICIVKEALETLANDGFPLAKLPDCYMLPHFKLWMDMRCKRSWTQADKFLSTLKSREEYEHALICVRQCEKPSLSISMKRANKGTAKDAKLYNKMVAEARERYVRENKQNRILDARELYPATASYECPSKTFRDVYFAYLPSKEEDCFVYRKWRSSEMKNMVDAKRCT